jgi:hypothetical protein
MKYLIYSTYILPFTLLLYISSANADDYSIDSPQVDAGSTSVIANLNYSQDSHPNLDHYLSQVYGVQHGVNSIWSTELDGIFENTADTQNKLTNLRWENIIAPFKPGQYWIDVGLNLQFQQSFEDGTPGDVETKFLFEKEINSFINTLNVSLSHNYGEASTKGIEAGYSWRTKYHINDALEPGFEYYSDFGKLADLDKARRQDNVIGPVLQGKLGSISYDTGVLFGVSDEAHDVTYKLNLEYDF